MGASFQADPHAMAQERADTSTVKVITANTTLKPFEQNVRVTAPASGTVTITLPPVAECRGKKFYIECTGTAGAGDIAIADQNDAIVDLSVGDNMTVADDYVCIENWGGRLWIVASEVTT